MSVLGWVSDESAEHGTDMDDNIDPNDHTDQGTGVDMAASTIDEVSHSNADDEEDGNSSDDGSESEYDFSAPPPTSPCGENYSDDFISAGNILTNTIATPTHDKVNPSDVEGDSLICARREETSADGSVANASVQTTSGNHVESGQVEQRSLMPPNWHGFKFVGDNIDRNFRPSFSRSDKTTLSLHCFHYYAVLDRVNLSLLSDVAPDTEVNADKVLINQDDVAQLQSDAVILISR